MTRSNPVSGVPIAWLACFTALLFLISTHGSYVLAAYSGHVDWCNPYWDSCTSISATGRKLPAKYVFKMGMLPAALMAAGLWWVLWRWLILQFQVNAENGWVEKSTRWMPVLGSLAALFLIQYTLALGEIGDTYRLLRRTGVVLTFALTFIAQTLFTRSIKRLALQQANYGVWYRRLLVWQLVLLAVGVISVVLDGMLGDAYDEIEDAFEWWMALLLNGYFILLALMLRNSKARLELVAR